MDCKVYSGVCAYMRIYIPASGEIGKDPPTTRMYSAAIVPRCFLCNPLYFGGVTPCAWQGSLKENLDYWSQWELCHVHWLHEEPGYCWL